MEFSMLLPGHTVGLGTAATNANWGHWAHGLHCRCGSSISRCSILSETGCAFTNEAALGRVWYRVGCLNPTSCARLLRDP